MKTQFISLMSHEFRTPITVIQTCAYLLETYFSMQQKDKFDNTLHKLLIAIDTTTKLLDNILFLDEIKEHSVMFSKIDIIAFIKYVVEEVSTDLEAKQSITVNTNVESLILLTDEKLIRKTINNLLANAIKYSPATSQITIDINDATSELNIIIADTGPGIADDVVTKIFETFVRSMTVTNISGAGLGLSIVKN
ncbi:Swarming motility regulation sensor protein RssA [bioreactor metagenome]|uniref:histidine kinase n=1 Tax=bioreactor metagenome TaxID=1076179 RepID=A0A645EP51_9ZZZZ